MQSQGGMTWKSRDEWAIGMGLVCEEASAQQCRKGQSE